MAKRLRSRDTALYIMSMNTNTTSAATNASIDAAIARLAEAIENPNTVAGLDAHAASITLTALIDARTILMTRRIQGAQS